jgi:hypothetical protein
MASVDFFFDTKYGRYCDAIIYPDDQPLTDADIEVLKQQRLQSWINAIENPSAPSGPDLATDVITDASGE